MASWLSIPSTFPDPSRRGVWIDGPELSRECLRYMYRLLFLFYAEADPRLNLLDLRNPVYATGYSLEALRDLSLSRFEPGRIGREPFSGRACDAPLTSSTPAWT